MACRSKLIIEYKTHLSSSVFRSVAVVAANRVNILSAMRLAAYCLSDIISSDETQETLASVVYNCASL